MVKRRNPQGITEKLYRLLPVWFNKLAFDGLVNYAEESASTATEEEKADLEQLYGSYVRGKVFLFVTCKAICDPRWKDICGSAMKVYDISVEEVDDFFEE